MDITFRIIRKLLQLISNYDLVDNKFNYIDKNFWKVYKFIEGTWNRSFQSHEKHEHDLFILKHK